MQIRNEIDKTVRVHWATTQACAAARRVCRMVRPFCPLAAILSHISNKRAVVVRLELRSRRMIANSCSRRTSWSTSAASAASSSISKYKLSWPLAALDFRRRCQPSTSLLVRIRRRKTDQHDGGHTAESTQVVRMYSHNSRCAPVVASASNYASIPSIEAQGKQGSASSCLQYMWKVCSLWLAVWRPSACILRHTACPQ